MGIKMEDSQRKSFSKKERYEVFKRDDFTCQYCGREAPDVILEVDHIKPIVEGGSNDLTNLVTSCRDCNRGKGARELSDNSEVKKRKKQLDELNKRRKQLEMMSEWRRELLELEEEKIDILCDYWHELTDKEYSFNENGEKTLRKALKDYSIAQIMEAMEIAKQEYFAYSDDGELQYESVEKATSKLIGICYVKKQKKENPHIAKLHYIKGILRNRFNYLDKGKAMKWLSMAHQKGIPLELLESKAKEWQNWTEFRNNISDMIGDDK